MVRYVGGVSSVQDIELEPGIDPYKASPIKIFSYKNQLIMTFPQKTPNNFKYFLFLFLKNKFLQILSFVVQLILVLNIYPKIHTIVLFYFQSYINF